MSNQSKGSYDAAPAPIADEVAGVPIEDTFGQKLTALCYKIRQSCSMAYRDSLFEQLMELIDPLPEGAPPASAPAGDTDDVAVDRFAAALKAKMADSRAKGRGGWDDPAQCRAERLQSMLCDHVGKGDPVDVGNFAMMLFNRGERTAAGYAEPVASYMTGHCENNKAKGGCQLPNRHCGFPACDRKPVAAPVAAEPANQNAAVAVIQYVLELHDGSEMGFLRLWNEGEFDKCRDEWPEAPEAVYIGADPLHPLTKRK